MSNSAFSIALSVVFAKQKDIGFPFVAVMSKVSGVR